FGDGSRKSRIVIARWILWVNQRMTLVAMRAQVNLAACFFGHWVDRLERPRRRTQLQKHFFDLLEVFNISGRMILPRLYKAVPCDLHVAKHTQQLTNIADQGDESFSPNAKIGSGVIPLHERVLRDVPQCRIGSCRMGLRSERLRPTKGDENDLEVSLRYLSR